jgi:transposase, IS6 family
VYRAIDRAGQVIDVFVSQQRDGSAARRFFERASARQGRGCRDRDDRAPPYPVVLEELLSAARHRTDRYATHRVEADHGRLKARL